MPTPSAPHALDPGWLLAELTAARVLDADRSGDLLAQFRAARWPDPDAAGLGRFLVQAGLLTPYQVDRALAREARTLSVGPYLLSEPVGAGSLGTVYRAVRRDDRKPYAVKVLPLRSMWNVLRAQKQVEVFAALPAHPAVVPFADIGTSDGSHYLAWPFVEGEGFDQLVRRAGPLPPGHAARFVAEVADGLAVCHAHGIVHGLLKPSNLKLGPDRRPRVLDLGVGAILADNVADDESLLDTISTANTAASSIDCAAPETLADPLTRSPAGDAYSLGCVLFYLLTGGYPFPTGNVVDKIIAHQTQPPPAVRSRNPQVPDALAAVVEHLLQKSPAARPADLGAVRDALARAVPDAGWSSPDLPPLPDAEPSVSQASNPWPSVFVSPTPGDGSDESVSFNLPDADDIQATILPGLVAAPPTPPPAHPLRVTPPARSDEAAGRGLDLPPLPVRWSSPAAPGGPARPEVGVPPPPRFGSPLGKLARALCFWLPPVEVVQVSVFGPAGLSPGQTARLQVYAHPPEAFGSVRTLSRAFRPDTELLAAGYVGRPVPHGGEVGLHLAVGNAGVARSVVRFDWAGQTKPWAFEVYVPWESPAGRTQAALTIGLNNAHAGKVRFEVEVLPRSG